jgi:hypothetical protein
MNIQLKLREALLKEFGEGDGLPFIQTVNVIRGNLINFLYKFRVPNEKHGEYKIEVIIANDIVSIDLLMELLKKLNLNHDENGAYLDVSFREDEGLFADTSNKGDVIMIMNTVKSIIASALGKLNDADIPLQMIFAEPTYNSRKGETPSSNRRMDLYSYLFKKNIPNGFEFFQAGKFVGIYKKQ